MGKKVGVRQGDCMSPVLFLFMVMAFSETLAICRKQMGLKMISFNTRKYSPCDRGSLTGQAPKTFKEVTSPELFSVLYVDNGDFPFENREQMTNGVQLISDYFKRFGLEMHIGRGTKISKTECVFFPPPGFLWRKQNTPAKENGEIDALTEKVKVVKESHEGKFRREEREYALLAETRLIVVSNGFVSFCNHFKYLGSWLSFPTAWLLLA